ncbi:MAG: glycosyltransferase [Candidatus Lokiarchaeota archaeon]|nr:glycosyltransferase [Candidatus Lokiarchaeota archaeon]
MPVFNGEKHLKSALDSLLSQSYKNFTLIISDNGSTDNTEKICRTYAQKDSRIRYYKNNKNIGAPNNFQKLLNMATTPYFMWAAHDDLWEPTFILENLNCLKKNNKAILVFCNFDYFKEVNNIKRLKSSNYPFFIMNNEENIFKRLKNSIYNNYAMFIYGIFRTEFLKKASKFPKTSEDGYFDDNLLLFRVAFLGSFLMNPKILFHKRTKLLFLNNSSKKASQNITFVKNFSKRQTIYRQNLRKIILKSNLKLFKKLILLLHTYRVQVYFYYRTIKKRHAK